MGRRREKTGIVLGALAIALAMIAYVFISDGPVALGQEPPTLPPQDLRGFDSDNNSVFDNLESTMASAAPQDKIAVIIQFNQSLDQVDFPGLEQAAGQFAIRHQFRSINGRKLQNHRICQEILESLLLLVKELKQANSITIRAALFITMVGLPHLSPTVHIPLRLPSSAEPDPVSCVAFS